jgi:hypothetical protein
VETSSLILALVSNLNKAPSSIASASSGYTGLATIQILLCLFGDLDKHVMDDCSVTVSL